MAESATGTPSPDTRMKALSLSILTDITCPPARKLGGRGNARMYRSRNIWVKRCIVLAGLLRGRFSINPPVSSHAFDKTASSPDRDWELPSHEGSRPKMVTPAIWAMFSRSVKLYLLFLSYPSVTARTTRRPEWDESLSVTNARRSQRWVSGLQAAFIFCLRAVHLLNAASTARFSCRDSAGTSST